MGEKLFNLNVLPKINKGEKNNCEHRFSFQEISFYNLSYEKREENIVHRERCPECGKISKERRIKKDT